MTGGGKKLDRAYKNGRARRSVRADEVVLSSDESSNGLLLGEAEMPAPADKASVHAGGATFSLAVPLPAGDVRLDFARPGGEARVSIWAVPDGLVDAGKGTGVVLGMLAVVFVPWGLVRRREARVGPVRTRTVVALVVLVAVLVFVAMVIAHMV